ncbi:hypothetical protein AMJ52_02630 [candidate division TA06 bacterium DG_78]|uniref:DUF5723 domain-containing protein n=1 Tax=candidate division TA06 bacterium DG_78 TaxID=1703772 RepID=A0A0S7YHB7_UNCT6|nr:MAG: hypothetical protein AMJ52_02630 [candidate division TA06 bacterium DG_78]
MSRLIQYIVLVILVSATQLFANDRPGAVFLSIPPGAKAVGMGSAFTASIEDPTFLYYNPGGLGLYDKFGFVVMNDFLPPGIGRFAEDRIYDLLNAEQGWLPALYPGMQYIYGAIIIPYNKIGNFGFSCTYLNTGITEVINTEGTYLGSYETYDYAAGLSYGKKIFDKLGIGITAKYIYSYLVPSWVWEQMPELGLDKGGTASSFAMDCGAIYRIWGFGVGASLQNLGPRIEYSSGSSDRLPTRIRWGISLEPIVILDSLLYSIHDYPIFNIPINEIFNVKFSYDRSYDPQQTDDIWKCSGWEFTFLKYLSYRRGSFIMGTTSGFGFNLGHIEVDIAKYYWDTYHIQLTLNAVKPPESIRNNQTLNSVFTIASAAVVPGGGQFYKGEGIKASAFFLPSLYLGECYFSSDSKSTKTLTLIGLGALYVASAVEALLN